MRSFATCRSCEKKRIVVLTGIHGSGKTTLGNRLQAEGFNFFSEIGTVMRKERSVSVNSPQKDFDLAVLDRELKRDREQLLSARYPIVETWHIGNLVFSLVRQSGLEREYEMCLDAQLALFFPLVIKLELDDAAFLDRNTEQNIDPLESLSFYKQIDRQLDRIITALQAKRLIAVMRTTSGTDWEYIRRQIMLFWRI